MNRQREVLQRKLSDLYQQQPKLMLQMPPKFVIENALSIINKEGEHQPLHLNKTQQTLLQAIQEQESRRLPVRIIILKARQQGISTFISAWIYLKTICRENTSSAVVADNDDNAQLLFQISQFFYNTSPEGMRPVKQYDRRDKGSVFAELHSRIDIMVAKEAGTDISGKTGRSRTYTCLHRSEVAFWRNARATMNALNQTVPEKEDTAIFDESTANGWGDDFHTQWERAESGKSDYVPVFFPWWYHEEYSTPFNNDKEERDFRNDIRTSEDDEYGNERFLIEEFEVTFEQLNWRRKTMRNQCGGSLQTLKREYPAYPEEAFQASGENALDVPALVYYEKHICPPIQTGDLYRDRGIKIEPKSNGFVRVWEYPQPYAEYVIGSDHAQGLDWGDFNFAVVLRRLPLQLVAMMSGKDGRRILPDDFGAMLALLGWFYNTAWVCPESNLDGGKAITVLERESKYNRLVWEDQLQLSKVHRVGWSSNIHTRRLVVSEVQAVIKDRAVEMWSEMMQKCGMAFVYVNGRPQAIKKGQQRKAGDPLWQYIDCPLFALGAAILAHLRLPAPKPMELVRAAQTHPRTRDAAKKKKLERGVLSYI